MNLSPQEEDDNLLLFPSILPDPPPPDFAQDVRIACDLVLSGHTHGGQVSLLRLCTPVKNSKYGMRFLRGLNRTDEGVPVITTNGVGTSRRKVRFCVPSEVVVVTLRRASQK